MYRNVLHPFAQPNSALAIRAHTYAVNHIIYASVGYGQMVKYGKKVRKNACHTLKKGGCSVHP